ncbi:antibiotic resistance protein MarC [Methylovulum psychrotolerans]|uniref:UPF0056 membrane protein n=2 Tax=Methylovulum psychrotolerans TaxID=1704499 RepID=A0A2S5CKM2_9GAMM|nr:antibiotic resistance protein MarC [Methylovulum psychrotolerans]
MGKQGLLQTGGQQMLNWHDYLQLLAGLVSVVNPIGVIPMFIALTNDRPPAERRHTAITCAFSVATVLAITLVAGEPILHFLGIGLPSFRVAGGLLIMMMGFSMLHANNDRARHTPEEQAESFEKDSIAVVPLAIPLLSGPGAISTMIVYGHSGHSLGHFLLVGSVILSVAVFVLLTLLAAPKIADVMGSTGMNVVTRVMGLFLTSIAVEFIATGLGELFPVLLKTAT